jgi:hypothetical protein
MPAERFHPNPSILCPECSHPFVLHRLAEDGPGCFGQRGDPSSLEPAANRGQECGCTALDTTFADLLEDRSIAALRQ